MSVYTSVTEGQMQDFLSLYNLGSLVELKGIAQGITNTNYFVSTTEERYILTIFETLQLEELPFFLELMRALSQKNIACPAPQMQKDGHLASMLAGKPACLVSCLNGKDNEHPTQKQCFSVGAMMAKMHLASQDIDLHMENPRHQAWWESTAKRVEQHMNENDVALLQKTIAFVKEQNDLHLPHGIIHADLFKDNVLLNGDNVAGFIDFYYACRGSFVYDIAIAINDWARTPENTINPDLKAAFLAGYQSIRALSQDEKNYLPTAQKAAILRFWVSRLEDYYFPAEGDLTFTKDPNAFKDLLVHLENQ